MVFQMVQMVFNHSTIVCSKNQKKMCRIINGKYLIDFHAKIPLIFHLSLWSFTSLRPSIRLFSHLSIAFIDFSMEMSINWPVWICAAIHIGWMTNSPLNLFSFHCFSFHFRMTKFMGYIGTHNAFSIHGIHTK